MVIVLGILIMLVSIVMIAAVLMQDSETGGISALSGGAAESFMSRNKTKALNAKLALITKICAAAFVVLCLLELIIQ